MASVAQMSCPHCRQAMQVPAQYAGRKVACPSCGKPLMVPAAAGGKSPAGAKKSRKAAPKSPRPGGGTEEITFRGDDPFEKKGGDRVLLTRKAFRPSKWWLILAVAIAGFFGWRHWQGMQDKTVEELFADLADGSAMAASALENKDITREHWDVILPHTAPSVQDKDLLETAARCLGRTGDPRAMERLKPLLESDDQPENVRVGAVDGMAHVREAETVGYLIERLAAARTLAEKQAIGRALDRLTGQGLGFQLSKWQAWWNDARAGYEVPPVSQVRGD